MSAYTDITDGQYHKGRSVMTSGIMNNAEPFKALRHKAGQMKYPLSANDKTDAGTGGEKGITGNDAAALRGNGAGIPRERIRK